MILTFAFYCPYQRNEKLESWIRLYLAEFNISTIYPRTFPTSVIREGRISFPTLKIANVDSSFPFRSNHIHEKNKYSIQLWAPKWILFTVVSYTSNPIQSTRHIPESMRGIITVANEFRSNYCLRRRGLYREEHATSKARNQGHDSTAPALIGFQWTKCEQGGRKEKSIVYPSLIRFVRGKF